MKMTLAGMGCLFLLGCSGEKNPPQSSAPTPPAEKASFEQMWVKAERIERRTCPSAACGSVGWTSFRESAHVYERRDGWARVTEPYTAMCTKGKSEFVEKGRNDCTVANGIEDDRFSEWLPLEALTGTRPQDPAESASGFEALVGDSDDFARYRTQFAAAAEKLIVEGRCTRQDFEDQGGWMKSVARYRDEPIYFTYCGGMTLSDKLYLDVRSGRVFQ